FFFFSSRRRHTRLQGDWSSDVCSSDLNRAAATRWAVKHKVVDDLVLDGPASRSGTVGNANLRIDVLDVVLGRPRRDEQLRRDLRSEERRVGKECRFRSGG